METITYILAVIGAGAIGYWITPKGLNKYIGEILYYDAANGKRYRVLKRPNETEKEAVARMRAKVLKDGTI